MTMTAENAEISSSVYPEGDGRSADELRRLMATLQGWKEFLDFAQSVLLWDKQYYSYCIAGCVSLLFVLWWYLDASVLTTMAFVLFLAVMFDLVIPSVGSRLLLGKEWDADREGRFRSLCQQMLNTRCNVVSLWNFLQDKKANNSISYTIGVMAVLFTVGLIGYWVNNTFLFYLFVLGASLYPGLSYHGYMKQCKQKILSQFSRKKNKKAE